MGRQAPASAMLLLLPAVFAAAASAAEPVHLVTPIAYGIHLPGLGELALRLARLIEERSRGALVLDLKQPGEGANSHEILDKVGAGTVDAGFAPASFWAAELPAAPLFSGYPFGPDAKLYSAWFEQGNGRKLYQEMYDHAGIKVHVMPCAFGGAEAGGWFTQEVKTAADLKELRMRIFGLGGRVMARLGATTVLIPGGKILAAFDKGEIDAAELYPPAVDARLELKDKVKLVHAPGWHQPETVLELIVNQDRWNALSDDQRGVIEGACREILQSSLADSAKLQSDALAGLAKDGVKIEPFPEEVLVALRAAWAEIAKEEGDRDYFFRTVLDDLEKFRVKSQGVAGPPGLPPQSSP
jgi:TRAP-type mannitol/chloroaromatic compound transport system substrate-binding protein